MEGEGRKPELVAVHPAGCGCAFCISGVSVVGLRKAAGEALRLYDKAVDEDAYFSVEFDEAMAALRSAL